LARACVGVILPAVSECQSRPGRCWQPAFEGGLCYYHRKAQAGYWKGKAPDAPALSKEAKRTRDLIRSGEEGLSFEELLAYFEV
jgi:hypothetical protein